MSKLFPLPSLGLLPRARRQVPGRAHEGEESRGLGAVAGPHQLDGAARHGEDILGHAERQRRR